MTARLTAQPHCRHHQTLDLTRTLIAAVLSVSTACVGSGFSSSDEAETICAPDSLGETSDSDGGVTSEGGDDGCMFVPYCVEGEDDGSTEKLDMGLPPDLPCDPCPPFPVDPPHPSPDWGYDRNTDTYYRYASETELDVHGWAAGTTLFSAQMSVAALTNGKRELTLAVPFVGPEGVLAIEPIKLRKFSTRSDTWFLTAEDSGRGPLTHAFRPVFHLYLPSWIDFEALRRPPGIDMFVWAYGDSHGGVAIQGLTADQQFSILGPSTQLWLETLPPDHSGVVVVTPTFGPTNFDETLDHWIAVLAIDCEIGDCEIDPDSDPNLGPGNCDDCIDNDLDTDLDTADLFCKHRTDFGCDSLGDHNHRWENSKDFAMMPDIEWCTNMQQTGMPWYAEVNMEATTAAAMLNAIPKALAWMHEQGLEQSVEVPDDLPTIHHRVSYCVFANDVAAAEACVGDADACPPFYHVGGVTHLLPAYLDEASTAYMEKLWTEFDQATAMLEDQGITPKPVAMLSSVYSGNLVDGIKPVIGYSGSIGALSWLSPGRLGATAIESDHFMFANVAHELGHSLGLSHTSANGAPVNLNGFMQSATPFPLVSLLGPSNVNADGYQYSNQWSNWADQFGNKTIPRPNAFAWTGCDGDEDCPSQLECWFFEANVPGVCRWPL